MKKSSPMNKNFFLISFLPAFAYWYLEENYPVRIAVAGGLALAVLEIILEKIFSKHIHTVSKLNFYLILGLGGLSLLGDEGIWFRLTPFFTGLGMGGFLFYQSFKGEGVLWKMMKDLKDGVPHFENSEAMQLLWNKMERHFAVFFISYGIFMAFVAIYLSTDRWIFFKTAGFYLSSFIFCLCEVLFFRKKIKTLQENDKKREILSRFDLPS